MIIINLVCVLIYLMMLYAIVISIVNWWIPVKTMNLWPTCYILQLILRNQDKGGLKNGVG